MRFDEHKVMIGFTNAAEARAAYLANYTSGWKCGPVTAMTIDQFKAWLADGDTTKPVERQVSRYARKPLPGQRAMDFLGGGIAKHGEETGEFKEEDHPRWQKGDKSHHGGRFAPKNAPVHPEKPLPLFDQIGEHHASGSLTDEERDALMQHHGFKTIGQMWADEGLPPPEDDSEHRQQVREHRERMSAAISGGAESIRQSEPVTRKQREAANKAMLPTPEMLEKAKRDAAATDNTPDVDDGWASGLRASDFRKNAKVRKVGGKYHVSYGNVSRGNAFSAMVKATSRSEAISFAFNYYERKNRPPATEKEKEIERQAAADLRKHMQLLKQTQPLPQGDYVDWKDAKPGDRLLGGSVMVARGFTSKNKALEAARASGGRVSLDGTKRWAVVRDEENAEKPDVDAAANGGNATTELDSAALLTKAAPYRSGAERYDTLVHNAAIDLEFAQKNGYTAQIEPLAKRLQMRLNEKPQARKTAAEPTPEKKLDLAGEQRPLFQTEEQGSLLGTVASKKGKVGKAAGDLMAEEETARSEAAKPTSITQSESLEGQRSLFEETPASNAQTVARLDLPDERVAKKIATKASHPGFSTQMQQEQVESMSEADSVWYRNLNGDICIKTEERNGDYFTVVRPDGSFQSKGSGGFASVLNDPKKKWLPIDRLQSVPGDSGRANQESAANQGTASPAPSRQTHGDMFDATANTGKQREFQKRKKFHRGDLSESLDAAQTAAQSAGEKRYLIPTHGGWAVSSIAPPSFQQHYIAHPGGRVETITRPEPPPAPDYEEIKAQQEVATAGRKASIGEAMHAAHEALHAAGLASKPTSESRKMMEDFGEKIGGARKDAARPTGKKKHAKEQESRPAWARAYEPHYNEQTGKWMLAKNGEFVYSGGYRATFESKEAAEKSIPLHAAVEKHSVTNLAKKGEPGNFAIYRKVAKGKYPVVKDGFATYEEAMKHIATDPHSVIEHKFPRYETYQYLDKVTRDGPTHREGSVRPSDFQDTFNFRGGEFGNWQSGKDGQTSLNHAYDALHDLSESLGLPARAMALDGSLAIAFGARGTGGLNAARAHYEPDKSVINLTKMAGSGSLAHEWAHALDHYMAKAAGDTGRGYGISHGHGPIHRKEIAEAAKELRDAMMTTDRTSERSADAEKKKSDMARTAVENHIADLESHFDMSSKAKAKPFTTAQQERWNELKAQVAKGDAGKGINVASQRSRMGGYSTFESLEEMNKLYKARTGRSFHVSDRDSKGNYLYWAIKRLKDANNRVAESGAGQTDTVRGKSNFLNEAVKMDSTQIKDYYTERHEMLARAFESYVADKLDGKERRSDYLVGKGKTDNRAYALYGLKPFPEGEERVRINAAFDKLFAAIKHEEREDERGRHVRLYRRMRHKSSSPICGNRDSR